MSSAGAASDSAPKFDVGDDADETGADACEGGGGLELSYIWIANTAESTISKIDTQTMVEEGRYQAHPNTGDPSRTSVNLQGDVAVANRNGGVAKFWANPEHCVESNGTPGIQTSSGGADVLPWGHDECLAWYTPLTCGSNRPVAWTRGTYDEASCSYVGAKLWTACDSDILLLDAETGAVEQTIEVSGGPFFYGGAADADGNFWALDINDNRLVRVGIDDFGVQQWSLPPSGGYGITVGPNGRPWVCGGGGVSRFNLDTSTWDHVGGAGAGGCMTDGESLIWHADGFGLGGLAPGTLLGYDIETLELVRQFDLPRYVHGISVDFQGQVWGVTFNGTDAYRVDPETGQFETFSGLVGAYTYSDMTGFALSSAGVGTPAG